MFRDPMPLFLLLVIDFFSYVLIIILSTHGFITLLTNLIFTPPLQISPWSNVKSTPNSKNVQSNWGGEFLSLTPFFNKLGIVHTSEQNGIVEHRHRHVVETGLALISQSHFPPNASGHLLLTLLFISSIVYRPKFPQTSPYFSKFTIGNPIMSFFRFPIVNLSLLFVVTDGLWAYLQSYVIMQP